MSDDSIPIPKLTHPPEGEMVDLDLLQAQCEILAPLVVGLISKALGLPDSKASWLHIFGVASTLIEASYLPEGLEESLQEFGHTRLVHLHNISHAYTDGGIEGVREYNARLIAAANEGAANDGGKPPPHHFH